MYVEFDRKLSSSAFLPSVCSSLFVSSDLAAFLSSSGLYYYYHWPMPNLWL
jgi:hypothetical protein